jgi:PfaD family protein
MLNQNNSIQFLGTSSTASPIWIGEIESIAFIKEEIKSKLLNLDKPCYFVMKNGKIGVTNDGYLGDINNGKNPDIETLTATPPLLPQQLGDPAFLNFHNVKYAYMTGAMANGIASEEMITALGKENILSSFGSGGLIPNRIEKAINTIQTTLHDKPYCFNLIHSPSELAIEKETVNLYLKYNIHTVEASAFLDLTLNIVYYRVAGLRLNSDNQIEIKNKIIAKISREEVATKFLKPAPEKHLKLLLDQGLITELQAKLASQVPMADDITVEADSGGHTDNRPLVCLLPSIILLRDKIQAEYNYENPVRIGAGGGIGTPQSALGAFMMGAAYVVTGSINQSCCEAGTSEHTKKLLAQAEMTDVMMAPAADMFEMGVKLQVLKRGTMFGVRSQKLFEFYMNYNSIDQIPVVEREKLEQQIFRKSLDAVWQDTIAYFKERDPEQIIRAENNPKRKMALIFRSYLGLSSRWSNTGEKGREIDYQIWCGPAMGSFNSWARDSYLANPNNRSVVDIAHSIMINAAYLYRLQNLKLQGIFIPGHW